MHIMELKKIKTTFVSCSLFLANIHCTQQIVSLEMFGRVNESSEINLKTRIFFSKFSPQIAQLVTSIN